MTVSKRAVRAVPVELAHRFCAWCAETLPVGHACLADLVECPTASGDPCGTCRRCLDAQTEDRTP